MEYDERLANKSWRLQHLYQIVNRDSHLSQLTLNEAQKDFHKNKHSRNIILKSRRLGFTTYECIDGLDSCLWSRLFSMLLISYNKESAQDIFEIVKTAWEHYPDYFKKSYELSAQTVREFQFLFPDKTTSKFKVRTTGRGGGYNRLHVSEFAKISAKYPEKAKEILTGAIPSVPLNGRVDIESTAEGAEGLFYEMWTQAYNRGNPASPSEYKAFFYNWRWDKEEINKTQSIIERNKVPSEYSRLVEPYEDLTDLEFTYYYNKWIELAQNTYALKREYPTTWQEAFETSTDGTYYLEQLETLKNEGHISEDIQYNPNYLVNTYWDIGVGHETAIWFTQDIGDKIHVIDYYSNTDMGMKHYIEILRKKGYAYNKHFAPHDMNQRVWSADALTRTEIARQEGLIYTNVEDIAPKVSIEDGIEAVRNILHRCYFSKIKCQAGLNCLRNYKKDWDSIRGKWKDKPRDDEWADGADAFRYFAICHRTEKIDNTKTTKQKTTLQEIQNLLKYKK